MHEAWSYLLATLGMTQIWLTGKRIRAGWIVGVATSVCWVAFATVTKQYGFIISAAFFATLHIRNWFAWKPQKETNDAHNQRPSQLEL